MSDTAHGSLAATKITKVTKTTDDYWLFVVFVVFVIFVTGLRPWPVSLIAQQQQQPTQAQQRPVFRGGTHFVRVDAYPTLNGRIVEGLKPEDFEVFEDGKPQAIESFDYVTFETFTPEAERREPRTQQEGFDLAADPRYRLFVVYVDLALSKSAGAVVANNDVGLVQQPLVSFFDRIVGPQDLYGFLTSRNSAKDLVLAQKTTVTISQIRDLWRASMVDRDDADDLLDPCNCGPKIVGQACFDLIAALKLRYRADVTYQNLMDLVRQLGSLRQERKNVVLATNVVPRWRPDTSFLEARGIDAPSVGIVNGRLSTDDRNAAGTGGGGACVSEFQRLAMMDFDPRYHELLDEARRENVSFYVITPGGLQAPVRLAQIRSMQSSYDDLKSLSDETGGIAVVGTNDLSGGMKRIADDLQAYYILGYYTTNTKFDGGVRKITVKTKANGAIRARREYRAPTEAEIAAMAAGPARPASRAAPDAPPAVIGEPIAYRVSRAQPPEKVSALEFARGDRLRVEWPILAPLDRREARVLDGAGKPFAIDLPVSEKGDAKTVVVELPLAPFARGTYAIELTAGSGGRTEQRKLTFTMK